MILVNIKDHPTNRQKRVFFYKEAEQAAHFERLLIEEKIFYEKQIDVEGDQTIYFGVKSVDFDKVKRLNYLTIGHFRKPFIPDKMFRLILITISMFILGLAIAGALLSS
jgi:hypothetical protein